MKSVKKIILLLLLFFLLTGCQKGCKSKRDGVDDSIFFEYISGYTTGSISTKSNIMIKLVTPVDLDNEKISKDKKEVAANILKIKPNIKGKILWDDDRTIMIYPDKLLPSGKYYNAELELANLYENVPKDLKTFKFRFQVIKQNVDINVAEVRFPGTGKLKTQTVVCNIETADWVSDQELEKITSVKNISDDVVTEWNHSVDKNTHKIIIKNLKRQKKSYKINLEVNAPAIGSSSKKSEEITVYGLDDFKYLSHTVVQTGEKHLKIQFSMPLKQNQDLKGLVRIKGAKNSKFLIEDNIIKVYPVGDYSNSVEIILDKNIEDVTGNKLGSQVEFIAAFTQEKPQIKWVRESGSILPSREGMIVPFEAISLKAVDVTVIEIYESNMVQFLQVNKTLNGNEQIKRVGRPVVYKTFDLQKTGTKNLYSWNRFNLDLTNIIKLKPGSLYQIRINFRKSQSLYSCASTEDDAYDVFLKEKWDSPSEKRRYWDYYYDYYYYDDWDERENPCHAAYYGKRRELKTNVLVSDLGIIAKGSETGQIQVYITDLNTTNVISGVDVEIYNYQNQLIGSGKTNSEGRADIKVSSVPFAVVAKRGKERGYLRIDDGKSLSMSSFDVGGTDAKKGLKGFIYGERGVWRPGDTVHLCFILEDKQKILPVDHPVIFELRDPKGHMEKRTVKTENTSGIYNFTFTTNQDAPTGNWRALIRVGGEVFTKKIKIETIKPNRLKVDLDFNKEVLSVQDKNITGNIDVKWLHGTPAKNLKVEYDVMMVPMKTTFKGYHNYSFDDPSKRFSPDSEQIFSGRLDGDGKTSFQLSMPKKKRTPGAIKAIFTGKIYEESGNFSIDKLVIPYYPYESFTGVRMPETKERNNSFMVDKDYNIEIATVDSYGKPVSRDNVEIEIYRVSWRWWWDRSEDDISKYLGKDYNKRILFEKISTKNGKAIWKMKIDKNEWGRLFIRVHDPVSNHSAGQVFYVDWPGWRSSSKRSELGGVSMLSVFADKEEYNVGEKVKVTIPAACDGRALVSIESGSKIIENFWVETKEGKSNFEFSTKDSMAPNVYVHVTLVQPHGQLKNDLPIRLYGIIPIKVVDPKTKLNPEVNVSKNLVPEKEVVIKVKEKDGLPMAYTVAVVDEGLLDITNFETPDPWNSLYSKEALGVKTWDVYDEVLGALANKFGPLLEIGGGGEIESPKAQKANRFKPVVKFLGPFYLNPNEEKTHTFIMPRYVGSVKTMVVAAHEGKYGNAETTSFVKESLMVLGTMPRVLGPGEKIKLPVDVFVLDDKLKNVNVNIKVEGPLTLTDSSTQSVQFEKSGDKFVYFDIEAKDEIGIGKVFITANSKNVKASYDIEIDIRPSNPFETEVYQTVIQPGKKWEYNIKTMGLTGTNVQSIEFSYLPPINLNKRLNYLIRYPHGCLEQTVSSVFPQLYLDKVMELTPEQKDKIQHNINSAIDKLKKFQLDSGGFSFWPGRSSANAWGTNYAGHFLIEAKNMGYSVPDRMISDMISFQKRVANKWQDLLDNDTDLSQSYRLYILALAGKPEIGAMNRMKEKKSLYSISKWRLAAAYALIGKDKIALDIIKKTSLTVARYKYSYTTYGSDLRDKAMILEALTILNKKETAFSLLKEIAAKLGDNTWYSTQTTAYSLIAVSKYTGFMSDDDELQCEYVSNKEKVVLSTKKTYITKELKTQQGKISVTNNGKKAVFVRFINQGIPKEGKEKEGNNIVSMTVTYEKKDGGSINPLSIKQGTDFYVKVRVRNDGTLGDLEDLALTQIFPSGWEILNARLFDMENNYNYDKPDYQDIRDDRVMTYFDLKKNEIKTFKIMLNASYTGSYYMPGVNCEAMYNNEVYSRKKGESVKVVK